MTKPIYELHKPVNPNINTIEYLIIVRNNGKTYGYSKHANQSQAKYQTQPQGHNYGILRFVGYISEKTFNEMIFVDLL